MADIWRRYGAKALSSLLAFLTASAPGLNALEAAAQGLAAPRAGVRVQAAPIPALNLDLPAGGSALAPSLSQPLAAPSYQFPESPAAQGAQALPAAGSPVSPAAPSPSPAESSEERIAAGAAPGGAQALAAPEPAGPTTRRAAQALRTIERSGPMWVIRNSANAGAGSAEQAGALDRAFDSRGKAGSGAASTPASETALSPEEAALAGKTLVLMGGSHFGRNWLLEAPAAVARKLGMKLVVVDEPGNVPNPAVVAPEDFIPADVFDHSEDNEKAIARRVVEFASARALDVAGVVTFFNPFVELTGRVVDAVRADLNPGLLGNSYDSVLTAHTKSLTRAALNETAPEVTVPYRTISEESEVEAAFAALEGTAPGSRVVLKPVTSAGKIGVRIDIASAEEAVAAYRAIMEDIRQISAKELGGQKVNNLHSVNAERGVIMELQLEGPEVDVEIVRGKDGAVSFVIGNPKPVAPYQVEKGFTLFAPLTADQQTALIEGALKALDATGLKEGNFHVEMMLRGGRVPMVIEINARMAGANGYGLVKKMTGFDLIEQGIRAVLGLPLAAPDAQHYPVLVSRKILPEKSGKVTAYAGLDAAKALPGVIEVKIAKEVGQKIIAPEDGYWDDRFGDVVTTGQDYKEAVSNMMAALAAITVTVEREDGSSYTQRADAFHSADDEVYRPSTPPTGPPVRKGWFARLWDALRALMPGYTGSDELKLSPRAREVLDRFTISNTYWVITFAIYYPLFSAVMKIIGGAAAVGQARMGYTGAVSTLAPFASTISKWVSAPNMIFATMLGRTVVWGLLMPAMVFFFNPGTGLFLGVLAGLMVIDGILVSAQHPLDLDAGGLDTMAKQYGVADEIDDHVRNHYGSTYEAKYSAYQFIFPVLIGIANITAVAFGLPVKWAFVGTMALSFLALGTLALRQILLMPKGAQVEPFDGFKTRPLAGRFRELFSDWRFYAAPAALLLAGAGALGLGLLSAPWAFGIAGALASAAAGGLALSHVLTEPWDEMKKGASLLWNDTRLLKRSALDSLERADWDLVRLAAYPFLGLVLIGPALGLNDAWGSLIGTLMIALANAAGMVSANLVKSLWKPSPETSKYDRYKVFFPMIFFAGLAALSMPAAYFLVTAGWIWAGIAVLALGAFLFNLPFKAGLLGARYMKQDAAAKHKSSALVFGISGSLDMFISGVTTAVFAALFPLLSGGLFYALVSGFILATGVLSWVVAPQTFSREDGNAGAAEKKN